MRQAHNGVAIIKVLRAEDLRAADLSGKADPYVIISTKSGEKAKSCVIRNNLNPIWNETLQLNIDDPSQPLEVQARLQINFIPGRLAELESLSALISCVFVGHGSRPHWQG